MNTFSILFLIVCTVVACAGIVAAVKANKILSTLKVAPVPTRTKSV